MAWKVMHNSEQTSRDDCFSGECPRFCKKASVTVHSVGSIMCKTDLQNTNRKVGFKCSLLEGTNEANFSPCMEKCPLVPQKYL